MSFHRSRRKAIGICPPISRRRKALITEFPFSCGISLLVSSDLPHAVRVGTRNVRLMRPKLYENVLHEHSTHERGHIKDSQRPVGAKPRRGARIAPAAIQE